MKRVLSFVSGSYPRARSALLLVLVFTSALFMGACAAWRGGAVGTPQEAADAGPSSGYVPKPEMFRKSEPLRPIRLPVNVPIQITFESDPVLYTAVSGDGKRLAYVTERGGVSALWLRSADPSMVVLPTRIATDPGKILVPAFSPDGRWIAYVGTSYDAKGDIFLMALDKDGARPRRLTARDTEDGAPCFFPDGGTLIFHQSRPPDSQRRLVTLDLRAKGSEPRFLDTGGDAAFPAISPEGSKCAFISDRNDAGGDLFVLDFQQGSVTGLTRGPEWDLFPAWSRDGESVFFYAIRIGYEWGRSRKYRGQRCGGPSAC